jgi:hypothetical protein
MARVRTKMALNSGNAGILIRRYIVAGMCLSLAAISALAQAANTTESVVVTLLPSYVHTTDPKAQAENDLAVAAPGGAEFKEAKSWLYFDAGVLQDEWRNITNVELQLAPKEGARRGMAITVSPAEQKSYSIPDSQIRYTLVSPPLPTNPDMLKLRSDSVVLGPEGLVKKCLSCISGYYYIGLVLLPQPNASRRVYYGLSPGDITEHPDRLPRLIITYSRQHPPVSSCASEPSALALIQSDGRQADTSSCPFTTRQHPAENDYVLHQVAAGSLTKAPVVYGDRLYAVRKAGAHYDLEELGSLGEVKTSVRLQPFRSNVVEEVRDGAPMVVDRFGRLRVITNDAILTVTLGRPPNLSPGHQLPDFVNKTSFPFHQAPTEVVSGPDGTLYIVKSSIYALNPSMGRTDNHGNVLDARKLWDVAIENPDKARITLNPDGRFLYALARFGGSKSQFAAINAQTGKDTQLLPGKVNTSGNAVTWVSGMKFDAAAVGQIVPIGSRSCTVETTSSTSLTCKEGLGTQSGVSWGDFPGDLKTFRNPVVVRGLHGVDYVYITGNSGSGATLWCLRNDPVTQDGSLVARLTVVWEYPLEKGSDVGQPILDPTLPPEGEGLSRKKLYFLETSGAGQSELITVNALDGTKLAETPLPAHPEAISAEEDPVVDSAGKVIFWANGTLYGFSAEGKILFTAKLALSAPSQLLFGPGGMLYAAGSNTVSALMLTGGNTE